MEQIRKTLAWLISEINYSVQKESNRGLFAASTGATIICGWFLSNIHISDFWLKAFGSFFMIVFGPPLTLFMNDLYKEKIKPKIFKSKTRY